MAVCNNKDKIKELGLLREEIINPSDTVLGGRGITIKYQK